MGRMDAGRLGARHGGKWRGLSPWSIAGWPEDVGIHMERPPSHWHWVWRLCKKLHTIILNGVVDGLIGHHTNRIQQLQQSQVFESRVDFDVNRVGIHRRGPRHPRSSRILSPISTQAAAVRIKQEDDANFMGVVCDRNRLEVS